MEFDQDSRSSCTLAAGNGLFSHTSISHSQPFRVSSWKNTIHLGTEYAALLVEPGYRPAPQMDRLPSQGGAVVAVAITPGGLLFSQTGTFRWSCVFAAVLGVLL